MSTYKIFNEVKELIGDYQTRDIQIVDGLFFQQYNKLKMVEFYTNSQYLQGSKDGLLRERPFYNICNFRVTLAKTASDLDIKDVQIESDDPKHYTQSMLLQTEAYEWMKDKNVNFSYFLNDFGQKRAKYGGVLVKRTMQKDDAGADELHIETLDWRNVVTDQVDILSGAIVETHYFTPVDLMAKKDVWTLSDLKTVIEKSKKSKGKSSKYDGKEETHNTDRIVIREITGMFSLDYYYDFEDLVGEEDEKYEYSLQHYFYADVQGKCYPLFCEEYHGVMEDHFMYLSWEEMPGRALGRGIVEDSEQAQIWTNDSVIAEKDAMDLAGKVTVVTTSKTLGGNILEVDNGRIFEVEQGAETQALQLAPSSIGEFQSQIDRWKEQVDQATSSFDANTGKQPPADTPYSQTALLNQVASKPFDFRREEAGIFISIMFDKWIIPYLVKKLYSTHLLASDFTEEELEVIDTEFATYEANQKLKPALLAGKIVSLEQYKEAIEMYKQMLKGSKRFLDIPKGYFDNIDTKVTVMTTGEQKNKGAILQSLSQIMQDVMKSYNPQTGKFAVLEDPIMARIFGTILELSGSGLSPISLGIGKSLSQTATQSPVGQTQAPQQQSQAVNQTQQPQLTQ